MPDLLIESLLLILVVFSPLIYGSISILPLTIVEVLSFLILFFLLLGKFFKDKITFIRLPFFPLVLFCILIILQISPLSIKALSFLSPNTASLYKDFMIGEGNSFSLSIYREATLSLFLQILAYLAVFFTALNYFDQERKIKRLLLAIILGGFFYSLYGIIRRLVTPLVGFSTFTNRDHFAAYMEMIIPLGIIYSLIETSQIKKLIFIFMSAVMSLSLFLTLSRAGIVCFSSGLLLFLVLFKIKKPIKKVASTVIILLFLLSFLLGLVGITAISNRLGTLLFGLQASPGRLGVLKDAPGMIQDFPIFGTGLGTFGDIFQKYKSFQSGIYRFSHNEPLQLLIETGILGFFCVFLFLLFYFKNIISVWLKRNYPFAIYITLGCLVGIFSVVFHSLFEFFLHVPANAILFFVILALAYRAVYLKESQALLVLAQTEITLSKPLRVFLISLFCLLFILIESLILLRYQAEAISAEVKERKFLGTGIEAIIEYQKALRDIDKAIALNPENSLYLSQRGELLSVVVSRSDLKDELVGFGNYNDRWEILELSGKSYKKAINLNPTRADLHLKLGWVYGNLGEKTLMQEEFKKALLLDPQNKGIKTYVEKYQNIH